MISILIPIYNYNISNLVNIVHEQAIKTNVKFEIICFDDKSKNYINENKAAINSLKHAKIILSEKNVGRTKARQILSNESDYDWLLFLDSDVIPKSDKFIKRYIEKINSKYEAFFGGFAYSESKPDNESVLRWKYGKKHEEIDAKKRNLNPHQLIISANFFIKKSIFNSINSKITRKSYGLDNYFGAMLKQKNINVFHLNNEVYHYGLEKSSTYLNKSEESVITLLWMYNEEQITNHANKLLNMFILFKKLKLNYLAILFYKAFNSRIKKNLISYNPNIPLLQIYKLSYICYKDLN